MDRLLSRIGRVLRFAALALVVCLAASIFTGCSCSNNATNDYASEDDAGYIGTWTGKLESTTTDPACYAAQTNPAEITVKSVDTTGRLVVDATVLYHGHFNSAPKSDVDTFEGDKVVTLADQTATLDNNKFSIVAEEGDGEIEIEGVWTGMGDSTTLELTVKSKANWNSMIEDVFTLTKQ